MNGPLSASRTAPASALACAALALLAVLVPAPPAGVRADPVATTATATATTLGLSDLPAGYDRVRAAVLADVAQAGPARAAALRHLGGPARQVLSYDGSGRGLVSEVFGDLTTASTVAVVVGGVGTDLESFERGTVREAARSLAAAVGPRAAVLAWADHVSPAGLGPAAARGEAARAGAQRLRATLAELATLLPSPRVVLVCHSYGSAVCAATLTGPATRGVSDVVDLAGPGVGTGRLPAGVQRWVALAPVDWIRFVPHVRVRGLGLGADPARLGAAHRLPVPVDGDHDDYLVPGSPTLGAVADLVAAGFTR